MFIKIDMNPKLEIIVCLLKQGTLSSEHLLVLKNGKNKMKLVIKIDMNPKCLVKLGKMRRRHSLGLVIVSICQN